MAKKYSVNMEDDQVVSVEVDGVEYASPDDIPDEEDREKIKQLISRSVEDEFDDAFDDEFDKKFEEDFRELEKQGQSFPRLIGGIFLGVALLLLAITALTGYGAYQRQSREQSAPGKVVNTIVRRSTDSKGNAQDYSYPVVEFSVTGRTLQMVEIAEGTWPPAYFVGDQVTVLYDPGRPSDARIKSSSSTLMLWLAPAIIGTLGAIFLIVSLIILKTSQPKKEEGAIEPAPL